MTKRKRPPRLEKPIKQYPFDQCALYGIKGTGQLVRILNWSAGIAALDALPASPKAYKEWKSERGRKVQEACPELRRMHARIATLLRRVEPPEYRHSGVRGRSFLTNAKCHRDNYASVKTDIKKFYPSVTFGHVFAFFHARMKCNADVAAILAKLCCFRGKYLPTGGVHSEVLAFYCIKPCFDVIAQRAAQRGGVASIYVDDIMVTMPGASRSDLIWMRRLFARYGLALHGDDKSRVFRKGQRKTITGVNVQEGRLAAPQAQHLALRNGFAALRDPDLPDAERTHAARSLIGHLEHIQQIDPRFHQRADGNRLRLRALTHRTAR